MTAAGNLQKESCFTRFMGEGWDGGAREAICFLLRKLSIYQ